MIKLSRSHKWVCASFVVVACAVFAAAVVYAIHYSDRALPQASVAGISVSGKDRHEVTGIVEGAVKAASANIVVDGKPYKTSLTQLGITPNIEGTVNKVFAANASIIDRFLGLFVKRDTPVVVETDDAKVSELAKKFSSDMHDPTVNASVKFNKDAAKYEVVPAHQGKGVSTEKVRSIVDTVASTLAPQEFAVKSTDLPPTVTTEQAQKQVDEANSRLDDALVVTDADGSGHEPSRADKASWLVLASLESDSSKGAVRQVSTKQNALVDIDASKVADWVKKLGESTNRDMKSGIKHVNAEGKVLLVTEEGVSGRSVENVTAVASGITQAIQDRKNYEGKFNYKETAATYKTQLIDDGAEKLAYPAAPGEKWIDVDLTNYTVTPYEGAKVVHAPSPMVKGDPETPTIEGRFKVYIKYAKQNMGCTPDWPYCAEDVPWVSYFSGNYALHGAYWLDSFTPDTPGSHGCVNLPPAFAKWLYDWDEIGTVVVSHR